MSSMLRTFIAVPISVKTGAQLRAAQQALVAKGIRARWTRPDQFHVTLKFLGNIPEPEVARVAQATESAVGGWGPFTLSFEGVGAFPDWARPRVLWAQIAAGREALMDLAERVEAALADLGYPREGRPFTPHVTLGRVPEGAAFGGPAPFPAHDIVKAGPERAERVVVYESRLTPAGAIYVERHSIALQKA